MPSLVGLGLRRRENRVDIGLTSPERAQPTGNGEIGWADRGLEGALSGCVRTSQPVIV